MSETMAASNTVRVDLGERSYDILIGNGLLDHAGIRLASMARQPRIFVLTDGTVGGHYAGRLAERLSAAALQMRPTALRRDLAIKGDRFQQSGARLEQAFRRELGDQARTLGSLGARLEALSHKSVLRRGFALGKDESGALVRQGAALTSGQAVTLVFEDTTRGAIVDGASSASPSSAPEPAARPKSATTSRKKPSSPDQGSLF